MDPNIYPDGPTSTQLGTPANTPVPIAKNQQFPGGQFVPLANNVGLDPSYFNQPTTFIRISMSVPPSAQPPQVELAANNPAAGTTGMPVVITATSAPGQALKYSTDPNATEAASAYFLGPFSNNVYLLKAIITIPGTTLNMRITNNTGFDHDFVWVVASTDALSQQPWIQLSPITLHYTALVNQPATVTAQSLQINNRGTGPLTVSNFTPALTNPYTLNPAGLANSGLPATVNPNPTSLTNVIIGFIAPANVGSTAPTNYVVDGDTGAVSGTGHNNAFQLSATTTALEVVMVLDDSGSMGATDTTTKATRLNELASASKIFLDYLAAFGANGGTIGIVKFPGNSANPEDLTSYDVQPAETIPSTMTSVKGLIDALQPVDSTPMDFGIQEVLNRTAPRYFATDATSVANNRRWMLLMSDGAWNVGSDPRTEIASLKNLNIVLFTTGYGLSGQVDYDTLKALSTGPGTTAGGQTLQVDLGSGYSAKALAQKFKTVITSGLTINTASDPDGVIFRGQEARYQIIITPYDTKAVFSLNWDTPDAGLTLQLLTPTCELITPQTAANTPGIRINTDGRYQMYVVDGSYLRNDANLSAPRHGTWRMIVSYPSPIEIGIANVRSAAPGEHYSYNVLTDSSLRLEVSLDRAVYYAGDSIGVSAKLSVNGLPITGASVQLGLTTPGQSMDNWLAGIPISADEYQNAARLLAGKDASAIYIKAFAANLKGLRFDGSTNNTTIMMAQTNHSDVYSATVNQTTIPDGHTLYVIATGVTADGVIFRRERTVEVRVGVRPDPVFTLFNIVYDPVQRDPNLVSATVSVTPRDRFGNVVLADPATSQVIALRAQGATLDPKLTTSFDGTYASRLTYQTGSTPTISLVVAGVPVFTGQVIPPVDQLLWIDQVLAFKPGVEGAPGANQHANPNNALGDIRQKQPDVFVSLGAYGSLAVGLKGQVILAQGDDDITVFVQPDSDLRSYLVEALPAGGQGDWVVLGTSPGTSSSFSLQHAQLTAARAIRITDRSGRTRDAEFKVSKTPGVSVRGVGLRSSSPERLLAGGSERFFIGFFSHGGVASVANFPDRFISPVDSYAYKQGEVTYEYYVHSTRLPDPRFVQGQRNPPDDADAGSGPGNLFLMLWNVDDSTGHVFLDTSYSVARGDDREETRTHDGCVKVYAVGQRASGPLRASVYYIGAPNMDPNVVRAIQQALSRKGLDPGSADGDYGPKTAAAVRDFQTAHSLVPDGEVGSKTAQALGVKL